MIIDTFVSSMFFSEVPSDLNRLKYLRNISGLYKTNYIDIESFKCDLESSNVEKVFLLPLDLSTIEAISLGSNDQVEKLQRNNSDIFIGFASVDPKRKDAVEVVKRAFKEQQLHGLYLHPGLQKFYPNDDKLYEIYKICSENNKPIIFSCGITMEPKSQMKFTRPEYFEDIIQEFPKLRICLTGFSWPWMREVAGLMLKYTNLFTDTSYLYFDSAKEFYTQTFTIDIGRHWIERSLRHQVMFASWQPRFEQRRMIKALDSILVRDTTKKLIFKDNALRFLEGGEIND